MSVDNDLLPTEMYEPPQEEEKETAQPEEAEKNQIQEQPEEEPKNDALEEKPVTPRKSIQEAQQQQIQESQRKSSSYTKPLDQTGIDEHPFINNIENSREVKHSFTEDFFMECLYISDHTEVVWTTVHMIIYASKKSKWFTIRGDRALKYNILRGKCMFIVGRNDDKVKANDRVVVKPNQAHKLSNYTDDEELEIEIEYEGFLDMHGYLQHVIEQ